MGCGNTSTKEEKGKERDKDKETENQGKKKEVQVENKEKSDEEKLKELVDKAFKNDDKMTKVEFRRVFNEYCEQNGLPNYSSSFWQQFKEFDQDQDGVISKEEARTMVDQFTLQELKM